MADIHIFRTTKESVSSPSDMLFSYSLVSIHPEAVGVVSGSPSSSQDFALLVLLICCRISPSSGD